MEIKKEEVEKLILNGIKLCALDGEYNFNFLEINKNKIKIKLEALNPEISNLIFCQFDAIATYYNLQYNPKKITFEFKSGIGKHFEICCEFYN